VLCAQARPAFFQLDVLGMSLMLLLPLVEEVSEIGGLHVAHVRELVVLGEDDVAVAVEDGEGGDAVEVDAAALGDVEVGVDAADVDVDLDEVAVQERGVGGFVRVNVEDLAVAAPVATEVDEDALVSTVGLGDGGVEIVLGGGDFGVDVLGGGRNLSGEGEGGGEGGEREDGANAHGVSEDIFLIIIRQTDASGKMTDVAD